VTYVTSQVSCAGPILQFCDSISFLLQAPGGGRILVVPGTMSGRRAIFTVAGCAAYELSGQRAAAEVA